MADQWSASALDDLQRETGVTALRDVGSLSLASEDFGRLGRGAPTAVVVPRDATEVERVLGFASQRDLPLTVRGGGNSQSGQSIPRSGVSLDTSRLDRIGPPDATAATIRCEAGARWRDIVARTAPQGMLPCVMPLNLDITVGGTLAAGGVGATSHRFGPAVAHVAELGAVTGDGRSSRCSKQEGRELFDAVLAGLGRCAVITDATLELRRVKPRVRTFYFHYEKLESWLGEQRAISAAGAGDYLEAFCAGSVMGLRKDARGRRPFALWSYGLHLSFEYEPGAPPTEGDATRLCPGGRLLHVEDDETVAFAARYDSRFEFMRRAGAWQQAHPWIESIVPLEAALELLPRVLDTVPLFLGDGHRVTLLAAPELPRFFMTPSGPGVVFAILPPGVPATLQDDALRALSAIHRMIVDAGGKRYVSGWLGMMDRAGWREHYGDQYDAWLAAKARFDPRGVLGSLLFPADIEAPARTA